MADLSDVLAALKSTVLSALYPNGSTGQFPVSIAGVYVRVGIGWPDGGQLTKDLQAGCCEVSIFPRDDEQNTTRFNRDWQELSRSAQTLAVAVVNQTVTWSGAPAAGLQVALIVNGRPYAYVVQAGDGLATIAAAIAALVNVDTTATVSGPSLTIPAAHSITARLGAGGIAAQEVGRQKRTVQITVWAPTPALRDAVAKVVDPALRVIDFLPFADGSCGRMRYGSSPMSDAAERAETYRRDLLYSIEYPTTLSQSAAAIIIQGVGLTPATSDNAGGYTPISTPVENIY